MTKDANKVEHAAIATWRNFFMAHLPICIERHVKNGRYQIIIIKELYVKSGHWE